MRISRRDALAGATAAVAVAAIPTTAQAIPGPTMIERLYAELRVAETENTNAFNAHDEAQLRVGQFYPERPLTTVRRDKSMDAYHAECVLIDERHGVTRLKRLADAAFERKEKIFTALLKAPAQNYRDVLLKMLSEHPDGGWEREVNFHDGLHAHIAAAVKRDLERLAGETGA